MYMCRPTESAIIPLTRSSCMFSGFTCTQTKLTVDSTSGVPWQLFRCAIDMTFDRITYLQYEQQFLFGQSLSEL